MTKQTFGIVLKPRAWTPFVFDNQAGGRKMSSIPNLRTFLLAGPPVWPHICVKRVSASSFKFQTT